jgi:hypothetical protein
MGPTCKASVLARDREWTSAAATTTRTMKSVRPIFCRRHCRHRDHPAHVVPPSCPPARCRLVVVVVIVIVVFVVVVVVVCLPPLHQREDHVGQYRHRVPPAHVRASYKPLLVHDAVGSGRRRKESAFVASVECLPPQCRCDAARRLRARSSS